MGTKESKTTTDAQTEPILIDLSKVSQSQILDDRKNSNKDSKRANLKVIAHSPKEHEPKPKPSPGKFYVLSGMQSLIDAVEENNSRNKSSNIEIELNHIIEEISEISRKLDYLPDNKNISDSNISIIKRMNHAIIIINELKNLINEQINSGKGIKQKRNSKAKSKSRKSKLQKNQNKSGGKKLDIPELGIPEYITIGKKLREIEQKLESILEKQLVPQVPKAPNVLKDPKQAVLNFSPNQNNSIEEILINYNKEKVIINEQICIYLEKLLNENFICPIGQTVFNDPVIADDGQTYERANILDWFKISNHSPLTNELLNSQNLKPNYFVLTQIEDLKTKIEILRTKININSN